MANRPAQDTMQLFSNYIHNYRIFLRYFIYVERILNLIFLIIYVLIFYFVFVQCRYIADTRSFSINYESGLLNNSVFSHRYECRYIYVRTLRRLYRPQPSNTTSAITCVFFFFAIFTSDTLKMVNLLFQEGCACTNNIGILNVRS